jgi:3-hydroxybutyrate dehydrogenase
VLSPAEGGRVALVTGASGGIGSATGKILAGLGHIVVGVDVQPPEAEAGEHFDHFVQADLASDDACGTIIDETVALMGRIDVLVNNAGLQHVSPVAEFPDERWCEIIDVMLTAPFRLSKHSWPHLVESGSGRIINVASVHGLVASPLKAAYVSAKHGLIGLTRVLALEGGAVGITANAVCPAYVRTPLVDRQIADQARLNRVPESEVVDRLMLGPAAVKRMIEPVEVAEMIAYLARSEAGSISGSTFTIDGGWTAR